MASKPSPFKLEVVFARREDGGMVATCDKLPAFYLSHSDPELVFADVEPVLTTMLSAMCGTAMRVERLVEFDEAEPAMPTPLCGAREYVGLTITR